MWTGAREAAPSWFTPVACQPGRCSREARAMSHHLLAGVGGLPGSQHKPRDRARADVACAFALTGVMLALAVPAQAASQAPPARPAGPCDIYAAAGTPCVAAHSTTRAL